MFKLILLLLSISFLTATAFSQTDNVAKAKTFIELLEKEDFATAHSYFNDEMGNSFTPQKLKETWQSINSQVGKFKKQSAIVSDKNPVIITCEFENLNLDTRISFNKDGKIDGLYFAPSQKKEISKYVYKAPTYANPDLFTEKDVTVGNGEWTLPATLTIPKGNKNFPAIVLVHGSGPNDRDETSNDNKVFKDLAWGLASKGIAVLRYDKRTLVHGAKLATLKNFTLNEETVDDAVLAVELLRQTPNVDKQNIFVLGHSLGGMAIPRIGLKDKNIKGLIVFAGTSRHLEDVILEQYNYLFSLNGTITPAQQAFIDKTKTEVQQIKSLKPTDVISNKSIMGIPASYWLDLQNYQPATLAKSLKQPILILQGERDYQVTMKDFQIWKDNLGKRKNVTFKTYPTLTHLFMQGSEKPSPKDYEKPSHVDENVVNDIANWILKISK